MPCFGTIQLMNLVNTLLMMNNNRLKSYNILKFIINLIEIYFPACCLLIMFISFIIGIFCRYILRDPQSWTYELSTICFFNMVIISWPYCQKNHKHIEFDMFYERKSANTKWIMRILSNLLITCSCIALFPASVQYILSMRGLKTQVLHLPRWSVFICFSVSLLFSAIRSCIDIYNDIKAKGE